MTVDREESIATSEAVETSRSKPAEKSKTAATATAVSVETSAAKPAAIGPGAESPKTESATTEPATTQPTTTQPATTQPTTTQPATTQSTTTQRATTQPATTETGSELKKCTATSPNYFFNGEQYVYCDTYDTGEHRVFVGNYVDTPEGFDDFELERIILENQDLFVSGETFVLKVYFNTDNVNVSGGDFVGRMRFFFPTACHGDAPYCAMGFSLPTRTNPIEGHTSTLVIPSELIRRISITAVSRIEEFTEIRETSGVISGVLIKHFDKIPEIYLNEEARRAIEKNLDWIEEVSK